MPVVCSAAELALAPHEATLLVAFIKADYDLAALIASQSLTDEQAIDFVCSPAIQARLGGLKKFTDCSDHLFCSKRRRKAIEALSLVIDRQSTPTGDPVELRKAATSLLRRTESNERATSTRSSSHTSSMPSPLSSDPRSEIPDPKWPDPRWPDPGSETPQSPTRAARLDSSPDSILRALASAASRVDTSETVAIVKSTIAEDATADGEPISDDSYHYSRGNPAIRALTQAIGLVQLDSQTSNTRATYTIVAVDGDGSSNPICIDFQRINLTSPTERWRITAIRRAGNHAHNGAKDTS